MAHQEGAFCWSVVFTKMFSWPKPCPSEGIVLQRREWGGGGEKLARAQRRKNAGARQTHMLNEIEPWAPGASGVVPEHAGP